MDEYTKEVLDTLTKETIKSVKDTFISRGVSKEDTLKVFDEYTKILKIDHDSYCSGGPTCHYDEAIKSMYTAIDQAYEKDSNVLTVDEIEKLAAEKLKE